MHLATHEAVLAVSRRLAVTLILAAGCLSAHGAAAPRPAAGEEYISAAQSATVHAPQPAPARRSGEGAGPFKRMVIRGATLIDGTGAPPIGPVDIVVEGNK